MYRVFLGIQSFQCFFDADALAQDLLEKVRIFFDPILDSEDRESVFVEFTVHLFPQQRNVESDSLLRAYAVHRSKCLPRPVLEIVQIDSAFSGFERPLHRGECWKLLLDHGAEELTEIPSFIKGVLRSQRDIDMQSTRPGGLAVSVDLKILKELVESLSHLYHLLEVILIRGIQVYHDVIRLVERADPGVPGVDLDAAKVCHVDQSRLFLTKH